MPLSSPSGKPLCYSHVSGHHFVDWTSGGLAYDIETPGPLRYATPSLEAWLAAAADRTATH